ncbi:MAG TPA: hypothetical protein VGM82_06930 [Gemmatimonadaceae bacterium]|jgi:uncharacterized protein involved in exopolysaccharide biosynthesis
MTDVEWRPAGDASLFRLGTTVLRHRWRLLRWMLAGAVIAAAIAFPRPALYRAATSFVPQGVDATKSGLASLAGQFGVSLPTSGQSPSFSPDFYVRLIKSHEVLTRLATDTLTVREQGGRRMTLIDLYEIRGDTPELRRDRAIKKLDDILASTVSRTTGLVEVSVATRWPSVSLALVQTIITAINDFNLRTRQEQAAAERRFVQGRLESAAAGLRDAEDNLEQFMATNRVVTSPALTVQRERLQRAVSLQQQVFTTLTGSLDEVRMRELRDTPVITLVETPFVPAMPEPRGIVNRIVLGIILGAFVGFAVLFTSEVMAQRRQTGDPHAAEFVAAVKDVRSGIFQLRSRQSSGAEVAPTEQRRRPNDDARSSGDL